jgi:hypothetical protein
VRGCLSVLVLGALVVGALVWFAGPPAASALVTTALHGSGLAADKLDVEVTADPPLILAAGRADRVVINATGARWNGVRMASLELALDSVDLVARSAAFATGHLDRVELDTQAGRPIIADVELSGPGGAAKTTIRLDAVDVEAVAINAFETHFRVRPSTARLVAPDIIRVKLGPATVDGRLAIAGDGSVVAIVGGASISLFTPDPSLALRLTDLTVASSGLTLAGTLDVGELVR